MPGPTLYRVRATLTWGAGSPGLMTAYYDASAGASQGNAQLVADRVRGSWDVFKTSLSNLETVQVSGQVDIIDAIDGSLSGGFGVTQPAAVVGTSANVVGAPQVMGGLELFTSNIANGRRVRGRVFLGPLHSGNPATIAPPASLNTNIDAFGVALRTTLPTPPVLCVWHRPVFDPVTHVRTRDGAAYECTSTGHATKWFTLRSRLN